MNFNKFQLVQTCLNIFKPIYSPSFHGFHQPKAREASPFPKDWPFKKVPLELPGIRNGRRFWVSGWRQLFLIQFCYIMTPSGKLT